MNKYRIHLLGLPQFDTNEEIRNRLVGFCPKIMLFSRMMVELGHEVMLYTGEHSTALATETVSVITDAERNAWLGDGMHAGVFASFDPSKTPLWDKSNERMVKEIKKREKPGDFIAHCGGASQRGVTKHFPNLVSFEIGCGYPGIVENAVVFESHSWREYCYGHLEHSRNPDGRYYDTVIPGYVDAEQYKKPSGAERGDDLVYVGRTTPRKGMPIIRDMARGLKNTKIVIMGPGEVPEGMPKNVRILGPVSHEEKVKWLWKARAVLVPTIYNEPFGNVVMEAGMCGAPVITTDYGSFPEIVYNGINGRRCNLLKEFLDWGSVKRCVVTTEDGLRARTEKMFGLATAREKYSRYLDRLATLYSGGWYNGSGVKPL